MPAGLAETAVQVGLRYAAGQPIGAGVATLADGFLKTLLQGRLTRAVGMVAGLAVVVGVGCLVWVRSRDAAPTPAARVATAVEAERQKLQGTWRVDIPVPKNAPGMQGIAVQEVRYIFRGSQWGMTVPVPGLQFRPTMLPFTIDPSQEPKAIDLTTPDGKVVHGIYRLEGDTLTLCLDYDPQGTGRPRPTEFRTDSDVLVRVLRREPAGPGGP